MTRSSWLRSRRLISERLYDTVFAATYDRDDAATSPVHLQFVADLAGQVPIGGSVLDAPCGTGKYFGPILEAGRNVVGCDQSAGMLAQAAKKFPKSNCASSACKISTTDLPSRRPCASTLDKAFADATDRGLPVVPGEDITRGGEYHYYPSLPQVRDWMSASGFTTIDEAHSDGAHVSYSYQHFHARR